MFGEWEEGQDLPCSSQTPFIRGKIQLRRPFLELQPKTGGGPYRLPGARLPEIRSGDFTGYG